MIRLNMRYHEFHIGSDMMDRSGISKKRILKSHLLTVLILVASVLFCAAVSDAADFLAPFRIESKSESTGGLTVNLDKSIIGSLESVEGVTTINFPISGSESLNLSMEKFSVTGGNTRFYIGSPSGDIPLDVSGVVMFRGEIKNEPGSHAFLAFTEQGSANGYVTRANGERYFLSHAAEKIARGNWNQLSIHRQDNSVEGEFPEGVALCGVETPEGYIRPQLKVTKEVDLLLGGPKVANVAIDADQTFVDLFGGNVTAASNYIVQLIGAISDIYERDVDVKLELAFVRMWSMGGEPFSPDDLWGFRDYWHTSQDTTGLNLIQMFSGRRNLSYGGVAYVAGTCSGEAYAIEGYLNGSFPTPVGELSQGNWDLTVVAHEMGHNFGTYHTHDGFEPTIDDCGNGVPSQGTIMSYCHIHPGYTLNIDLRFHSLVQEVIEQVVADGGCHNLDCNDNGVHDAEDISLGTSFDVNSNGIPDECEDCNNNGILDDIDIASGMWDLDDNGIPDVCQPDCNNNGLPDEYELELSQDDANGNNVPDECDPDCDGNDIADHIEIASGAKDDYDRNGIPDICQDCDGNQISDWLDLGRQGNIFVSEVSQDFIREYHRASGVPITSINDGLMSGLSYITFGPDRQLYACSQTNSRILKINVDNGATSTFIASGSGGLTGPRDLIFTSVGNLLVADWSADKIIKYDGNDGSPLGDFVSAGSGGLDRPLALTFGPDGNLYVSTGDNRVLKYDGSSGSYLGEFVSAGSGGLSNARGLVFKPDGKLLVVSGNENQILEYNGSNGNFLRVFSDEYPLDNLGDITIAPNGNVYVVNGSNGRVMEFVADVGRYYRSYVRGDSEVFTTFGLALRPQSDNDCDGNGKLDACDIVDGTLHDVNLNGYPDECETNDSDEDGIYDFEDNCPQTYNPDQEDDDGDGNGDLCDICPGYDDNIDSDSDTVPDGCDICEGYDDNIDTDADGVPDGCDICAGYDDNTDTDLDGVPDGCDLCEGFDDSIDTDGDGVPDGCDICAGYDDNIDTDSDGVPDGCDVCPGFDDNADIDSDGIADGCDNCPDDYNPDQIDTDGDEIGDVCDYICGDANGDGSINLGDAGYIINYIFYDGPAPDPIESGDANSDGSVNLADAGYLINYIFYDGPEPCSSLIE